MSNYNIDNHKLMFHPKRVSDWLEGKKIYPIYVEISLTNRCNHNCRFCAISFLQSNKIDLDTPTIMRTIENMAKCGVKAIMFGGEGEPLLHKDFIEIAKYAKSCGMDIALTTNGVFFNKRNLQELLPILSWVKISIDSGDVDEYAKLHGTRKEDFKTVLDNISRASFLKRIRNYNCIIGVQSILFKENIDTLPSLAKLLKYLKPDYFVVKPYSPHEKTFDTTLEAPTDIQMKNLIAEMEKYKNDYEFIYRDTAFSNVNAEKPYNECYGRDFIIHIDTLGGVYSCINYIGEDSYCYGNIHNDSFENIWRNKKMIHPDLNRCRTICRLDNINRYLWELKNPSNHVNFI